MCPRRSDRPRRRRALSRKGNGRNRVEPDQEMVTDAVEPPAETPGRRALGGKLQPVPAALPVPILLAVTGFG